MTWQERAAAWTLVIRRQAETWLPYGWVPATVLTLLLGLYRLGDKRIWYDERITLEFATGPWSEFADSVFLGNQSFALLHYSLLRVWTVLGQDLTTIRLLSVVFAVATVPVLFLLSRRLGGAWVAVLATLLLSVNTFFVRYAQEARSYTLAVLLVTSASYLLLRLLDRPSRGRWLAYGLAAVAALSAHYYAGAVLLVHLVVIVRRGLVSRNVLWGLAIMVAFGALLGWYTAFAGSPRLFIEPTTDQSVMRAFSELAGGITDRETLHAWAYLAAATAGACLLRPRWSAYFLAAWLLVPWVLVIGASLAWRPLLVPRYMIVTLPGLVVLVAAGLASIRSRWLLAVALTGLLALSLQGLGWWYFEATKGRQRTELPAVPAAMVMRSHEIG